MKLKTVTVREGEECGPIDWSHEWAKTKPGEWKEAEIDPAKFLFKGREIITICMYDGWPYWKPSPAIAFIGPLNCLEWTFFNSYGVNDHSIRRSEP
jgi:hypothetical protein